MKKGRFRSKTKKQTDKAGPSKVVGETWRAQSQFPEWGGEKKPQPWRKGKGENSAPGRGDSSTTKRTSPNSKKERKTGKEDRRKGKNPPPNGTPARLRKRKPSGPRLSCRGCCARGIAKHTRMGLATGIPKVVETLDEKKVALIEEHQKHPEGKRRTRYAGRFLHGKGKGWPACQNQRPGGELPAPFWQSDHRVNERKERAHTAGGKVGKKGRKKVQMSIGAGKKGPAADKSFFLLSGDARNTAKKRGNTTTARKHRRIKGTIRTAIQGIWTPAYGT